ncbi:MAG: M23 family metallopeptidase [Marmoricola sp.]
MVEPTTASAPTPSASPSAKSVSAGRRRATKPVKPARTSLLTRIPAVPTLVGLTALAIAGTGAVTLGEGASAAPTSSAVRFSAASAKLDLGGTDAIGFVGTPRAMAISRDSERQALEDAADAKLKQAAEQQANERNAELKSLGRAAEARASEIAKNQWVLPVIGYRLTARFGMAGGLWSSNHTGLDFAAPSGTPIAAVANGVITKTGYEGSYGNQTVETLEDGTEIWYNHQSVIGVQVGDTVSAGQQVGNIGSTGNSTGPHLHLEVRPGGGDPVDPFTALVFHGLTP